MVHASTAGTAAPVAAGAPAWLPGRLDAATYKQRKEACTAWALAQLASDTTAAQLVTQRRNQQFRRRAWQAAALVPVLLALTLGGLAASYGAEAGIAKVEQQVSRFLPSPLQLARRAASSKGSDMAPLKQGTLDDRPASGHELAHTQELAEHTEASSRPQQSSQSSRQSQDQPATNHRPPSSGNSTGAASEDVGQPASQQTNSVPGHALAPRNQSSLALASDSISESGSELGEKTLRQPQSLHAEQLPGRVPPAARLTAAHLSQPQEFRTLPGQAEAHHGAPPPSTGSHSRSVAGKGAQQDPSGSGNGCESPAVTAQLTRELQACINSLEEVSEHTGAPQDTFAGRAALVQGAMCVILACGNIALVCLLLTAKQRIECLKAALHHSLQQSCSIDAPPATALASQEPAPAAHVHFQTSADSPDSADSSASADKENRPGLAVQHNKAHKQPFGSPSVPPPANLGAWASAGNGIMSGLEAAMDLAGQAGAAAMGAQASGFALSEGGNSSNALEASASSDSLLDAASDLDLPGEQPAQMAELVLQLLEAKRLAADLQAQLEEAGQKVQELRAELHESDSALVEAGEQLAQQLHAKRLLQSEVSVQSVALEQLGKQLQLLRDLQSAARGSAHKPLLQQQPDRQDAVGGPPVAEVAAHAGGGQPQGPWPESSPLKKRMRLGGLPARVGSCELPDAAQHSANVHASSNSSHMPTAPPFVLPERPGHAGGCDDSTAAAARVPDCNTHNVERLQAALQAARSEAKDAQDALISAEIQISVLTGQLHSQPDASVLSGQLARLQADLAELSAERSAALALSQEQAAQLDDVHRELADARAQAGMAEQKRSVAQAKAIARQHELEGQLADQKQQNCALLSKLSSAHRELAEAVAVARGLKEAHQASVAEAASLAEQLCAACAQRDSTQAACKAAEAEVADTRAELDTLQRELAIVLATRETSNAKLETATASLASATCQLSELRSQVQHLQQEAAVATALSAAAMQKAAEAERQLSASQAHAEALTEQLQEMQRLLDGELGQMDSTRLVLGHADADVTRLEAELATQREANRVLAGRLEDVRELQAQLGAAHEEVLHLRGEVAAREAEIQELWEQLSQEGGAATIGSARPLPRHASSGNDRDTSARAAAQSAGALEDPHGSSSSSSRPPAGNLDTCEGSEAGSCDAEGSDGSSRAEWGASSASDAELHSAHADSPACASPAAVCCQPGQLVTRQKASSAALDARCSSPQVHAGNDARATRAQPHSVITSSDGVRDGSDQTALVGYAASQAEGTSGPEGTSGAECSCDSSAIPSPASQESGAGSLSDDSAAVTSPLEEQLDRLQGDAALASSHVRSAEPFGEPSSLPLHALNSARLIAPNTTDAGTPARQPLTPMHQQRQPQPGTACLDATPPPGRPLVAAHGSPFALTPTSARRAAAIAANHSARQAVVARAYADDDFLPGLDDDAVER